MSPEGLRSNLRTSPVTSTHFSSRWGILQTSLLLKWPKRKTQNKKKKQKQNKNKHLSGENSHRFVNEADRGLSISPSLFFEIEHRLSFWWIHHLCWWLWFHWVPELIRIRLGSTMNLSFFIRLIALCWAKTVLHANCFSSHAKLL